MAVPVQRPFRCTAGTTVHFRLRAGDESASQADLGDLPEPLPSLGGSRRAGLNVKLVELAGTLTERRHELGN